MEILILLAAFALGYYVLGDMILGARRGFRKVVNSPEYKAAEAERRQYVAEHALPRWVVVLAIISTFAAFIVLGYFVIR